MKTLKHLRDDGYCICVPQRPKIDTGVINKLQCQLLCRAEEPVIHVAQASEYLVRGISVVDENGDLVTPLDSELDKKLLIIKTDLNLWYALLQSGTNDEAIEVEILNSLSTRYLRP